MAIKRERGKEHESTPIPYLFFNLFLGVRPGQTVEFDVKFSFEKCDKNTPDKVIIPIVVTGN